jgi:hypothetical protein
MATTLTLGSSSFTDFTLVNNSSFNSIAGLNATTNLGGSNTILIHKDSGINISGTAGDGGDSLTVSTALTGSAGTQLTGGGGNDTLTINSVVGAYKLEGGTGNDVIIINANINGGQINGNEDADSIVIGASSRINGSTISGDNNGATGAGADTLVLLNTANNGFNNGRITNFSKANDTLIIGSGVTATTITSADWGTIANGTYTGTALAAANTGSNTDIAALASFLSNGNNNASITII